MKKFFSVTLLAMFCYVASAVSLKLTWCPSPDSNIASYKVYYTVTNKIAGWTPAQYSGTNCVLSVTNPGTNWLRNYTTNFNIGLTNTYTISNAVVGKTYYIAVTAIDSTGLESLYSNEAERSVTNFPPTIPQNLQIIDIK